MLKGYGNNEQISRGRRTYGAANADFNAVIAGLMTALAEGGNPERLPALQADMQRGASALATFCKTVDDLLPATTGQKSWLGDTVKEAIEPLTTPLTEAVSTIHRNHRDDKAATRLTIRTQLEAAKWPEFDQVEAAH